MLKGLARIAQPRSDELGFELTTLAPEPKLTAAALPLPLSLCSDRSFQLLSHEHLTWGSLGPLLAHVGRWSQGGELETRQDLNRQRQSELLLPNQKSRVQSPVQGHPHLGVAQITGFGVYLLGTIMWTVSGVIGPKFPRRDLTKAGQGSLTKAAAHWLDKVWKQKARRLHIRAKWSAMVPGGGQRTMAKIPEHPRAFSRLDGIEAGSQKAEPHE